MQEHIVNFNVRFFNAPEPEVLTEIRQQLKHIQERLNHMPTTQDLEAVLVELKQAIADCATRVIDKLGKLNVPQADIDDIRGDMDALAKIGADPAPETPAA